MIELTPADVAKYIIKIKLNFENAYITSNDIDRELLIESWYDALKEYPKEICDKAFNNTLKRAKFAPRLGDITEEINNLLSDNALSDEELWAELSSKLGKVYEISRYLIYPQHSAWASRKIAEIYESLPKELKLYAVNTAQLIDLSEMSYESLQYERARFFKQMPQLKKR